MTDKELLFQILDREVVNVLNQFSPAFSMFSPMISNFVKKTIEPYIDAFCMGTTTINTDAAGSFVKKEISEKVDAFIKQFNDKRDAM